MRGGLRILGIGSPHGDDQIGWRLVEEVGALRPDLGATVLSHPLELLEDDLACDTLIVVDACRTGAPAGTVTERVWPWEADPAAEGSTHGYGLTAALTLAERLRRLPPEVRLFGVEAAGEAPLRGLSPELTVALPKLARRLRERLSEWERRAAAPVPISAR